MPTTYHKKYKQNFQEEIYERYQNLSEEKIDINMYVESIKIFLKKKKTKCVSTVVKAIKICLKMKSKN